VDDIDHLGNRPCPLVGGIDRNQYRIGLVKWSAPSRRKMSFRILKTMMPHDLINAKPYLRS